VGAVVQAQSPETRFRARLEAFYRAFASGSSETFETMAAENFTPELLAQSSAERRKVRFDRIVSDFGKVALTGIEIQAKGAVLTFEGAKGLAAHVDVDMEPKPPYRIAGYLLKVDRANPVAPPPVSASRSAAELGSALDAYFAPLVSADKFSGVVLVARDGSSTVERAYGSADRETRTPNAAQTRFNLGSIGKLFTKTAIALLAADGKLALTDTLGNVIPDYPNEQARAATLAQLLTHRVGIADFFGPEFDAAPKARFRSNADFYRFVAGKPVLFAPGEKTQYCNGCYVVLGAVIERVAGLPYEQFVSERVFKPAGMKAAGFLQSDRFPPHVAVGYTLRAPGQANVLQSNTPLLGAGASAAGGAYATAADLLAFDNALREGRLLDPKLTAWVLEARTETPKGRRATGALRIEGGAQGLNAILDSDGTWTVIVLGNLDPPFAGQVGAAIAGRLRRSSSGMPNASTNR
jgi:CubicO group peptidase (beta-lactamase class C family)